MIFLVNKIDNIPEEINKDLLKKNIISKIIKITNIKDPKVIFVSAKKHDG